MLLKMVMLLVFELPRGFRAFFVKGSSAWESSVSKAGLQTQASRKGSRAWRKSMRSTNVYLSAASC
jgi:hypothetical protein